MNQVITTTNLDISKPASFADFVTLAKTLQNELDAAWGIVEQQMLDRDITQLKGEWGTVSIGERKNWKATGQLPPRFYKQTLDTTKLNFMLSHGDTLPAGVDYSVKQYLTKRIK
jgi:hypothetical protein